MAWLGFVIWITIFGCFFLSAVTGRAGWALLSGWLIPILAMALSFRAGMVVNGLMVLLCLLEFLLCRRGLAGVRMWNIKQRRRHPLLFGTIYGVTFLFLFYSLAQAQIQGYVLNVQGWGAENLRILRLLLTVLPLLLLNEVYTAQLYTAVERCHVTKRELILLSAHCFMANESGGDKILRQGYYLEGVNNGVTYHFRLTKRTFRMLKKEKTLRLLVETGLFGGMYVTELENEAMLKRVRKQDRKTAKIALGLLLPVVASGIWLFWLR